MHNSDCIGLSHDVRCTTVIHHTFSRKAAEWTRLRQRPGSRRAPGAQNVSAQEPPRTSDVNALIYGCDLTLSDQLSGTKDVMPDLDIINSIAHGWRQPYRPGRDGAQPADVGRAGPGPLGRADGFPLRLPGKSQCCRHSRGSLTSTDTRATNGSDSHVRQAWGYALPRRAVS